MADVKWIKITTDIFDDEKMLLIESMPAADSIITIWFKLLVLSGKQNNNGVFLMNDRIPYTDEMLATIFRRDVQTVRLALTTFQQFGMIDVIDNVITIPKWNKHQTLDSYEKKKERDRIYQAERRANQKALVKKSSDKSSDVAISDKEEDKEEDIDINNKGIKIPKEKSDFDIALEDFAKMRKLIKKPFTENAKKRLLGRLEKLAPGNDEMKIAILNQSVDHCWQDVYELKDNTVVAGNKQTVKQPLPFEPTEVEEEMSDEEWLKMMEESE